MIILGWECLWSQLNYSHGLEMLLHNKIGQLQCLEFINPLGFLLFSIYALELFMDPLMTVVSQIILKSNSTYRLEFIKFYLFSLK